MQPCKVLVIGAAGALGQRLVTRGVANGHAVTAFVRDARRFARLGSLPASVKVIEGDAMDPHTLSGAVAGQDAVVSAAGTVGDGDAFVALFAAIVDAVARQQPGGRFWAVAGAAVLTLPHRGGTAIGLPGVPKLYRPHERNWQAIAASGLDWSLMCPGPMVAAPDGQLRSDLRVSADIVPYAVPAWARWAPGVAVSLLMKRRLPELIVSYEDVAEVMMRHLDRAGPYSRHRVGIALPAGAQGSKQDGAIGTVGI